MSQLHQVEAAQQPEFPIPSNENVLFSVVRMLTPACLHVRSVENSYLFFCHINPNLNVEATCKRCSKQTSFGQHRHCVRSERSRTYSNRVKKLEHTHFQQKHLPRNPPYNGRPSSFCGSCTWRLVWAKFWHRTAKDQRIPGSSTASRDVGHMVVPQFVQRLHWYCVEHGTKSVHKRGPVLVG